MTEIPEHLRKRAEEARRRRPPRGRGRRRRRADAGADAPRQRGREQDPRRTCSSASKAAKAKAEGGDAATEVAGVAVAARVATATAPPRRPRRSPPAPAGTPSACSPSSSPGSIQDVKATPQDKVHVWPHLLVVEFVAALACTAFLLVFSIFVNAPLLELANPNQTPNPSKAPWYFLGLQELLTMFHPMVAGVTSRAWASSG